MAASGGEPTYLLRAADGRYLSAGEEGLALVDRCGDGGIWVQGQANGGFWVHESVEGLDVTFRSVTTGQLLDLREPQLGQMVQAQPAPPELPSVYLERLRTEGCVLITDLLTASEAATVRSIVFDEMEAQKKGEGARGAGAWDFVRTCPLVLRFHTHPVMLWTIGEYLGTPLLRAAHPPVPRVADPGSGDGGWHNDTPYQQLMQRGFPEEGFGEEAGFPPLGLQCNMCIDEYSAENGGTMYEPGSWRLGKKPPPHFRENNAHISPEAANLIAPPGSVFCYHAATWHRMYPNTTDRARLGLLQSFTPDFTLPEHAEKWAADSTPSEEDARERLAGWLAEQVGPEMAQSHNWLGDAEPEVAGGGEALTERERRDVASLWVGTGGGAARPRGEGGGFDAFGRVQEGSKL